MTSVTCTSCGERIANVDDPICPTCGCADRLISVSVGGSLELHSKLDLKKFRANESRTKGLANHTRTGDDLHRDTGQWRRVTRVIDYENDAYFEHIEDHDGNVVRHVDEPLSQHRGRGSAKHSKRDAG
jgi:hypothetical protein